MFKRSRRKIVAAIMTILILLWASTLGVIYSSSYFEMRRQNEQMLMAHANMYTLSGAFDEIMPPGKPKPEDNHGMHPGFDPQSPMFQLSTFYTVALSYDGTVLEIKNDPPTIHTDDALQRFALEILRGDAGSGTRDNLSFHKADKGGYVLVVFMDNTVVNARAMSLFRYTLICGGVALVLFFFLSREIAKRIVKPLEESYQKQKQFISDAGHELKTPVAVVSANAELLSREIGENQWLQNIRYENQRMGVLVCQLLELARTENITPQMERIDFSRLVAGEALPFEGIAFEKGLLLNCRIAEGIDTEGDSAGLKQVVSILLDNAIRHSSEQGEILLTLTREHGTARLSVINQGEEIPAEQRANIFERFYRIDTARNDRDGHYGLGLAIAKAIVTSHKGHIGVRCFDGSIEFTVQLPALTQNQTIQ